MRWFGCRCGRRSALEMHEGRHPTMPVTPFISGEVFFELELVSVAAGRGPTPDDRSRSRRPTSPSDASSSSSSRVSRCVRPPSSRGTSGWPRGCTGQGEGDKAHRRIRGGLAAGLTDEPQRHARETHAGDDCDRKRSPAEVHEHRGGHNDESEVDQRTDSEHDAGRLECSTHGRNLRRCQSSTPAWMDEPRRARS